MVIFAGQIRCDARSISIVDRVLPIAGRHYANERRDSLTWPGRYGISPLIHTWAPLYEEEAKSAGL